MSEAHVIEYIPLGSLKPDPRNPRTHSKNQVQQIADSIGNSGYFNPILVEEDSVIICGHGRYRAAQLQGRETVPVIRLGGLTAAAKRALRIAEAAFGPDHPIVATGVNNLGGLLKAQGDLAGARERVDADGLAAHRRFLRHRGQ